MKIKPPKIEFVLVEPKGIEESVNFLKASVDLINLVLFYPVKEKNVWYFVFHLIKLGFDKEKDLDGYENLKYLLRFVRPKDVQEIPYFIEGSKININEVLMACCLLGEYISQIDLNVFFSRDIKPISEEAVAEMLNNHREFIQNNYEDDIEDISKLGKLISTIMGRNL